MTGSIPASALVLVAIITNARDLEIARVLGWYRIPLRRATRQTEVAAAVIYLASDAAACTTGITIAVDGGMTCNLG